MTHPLKRLTALILALALVFSCAGCKQNSDTTENSSASQGTTAFQTDPTVQSQEDEAPTDPAQPGTTAPDATMPTGTEPIGTEPVTTEPISTEPVATEPSATTPESTTPPTQTPDPSVTEPAVTEPPATVPPATEPTATEPAATEPAVTEPAVTEPPATTPPATDSACSHRREVIPGVAPTCTTPGKTEGVKCSKCGAVLTPQTQIPATGHQIQVIAGKAPTATADGLTAGKNCTVCSAVLAKQVKIPSYAASWSGDYYYRQLATQAKGEKMQTLYSRIDTEAMAFHFDTGINAQNNIAVRVKYSDLGLSAQEALLVWLCYRNDHPLYYWITGRTSRTSQELSIVTDDAYAKGAERGKYNAFVHGQVQAWLNKLSGEDSAYQRTLALHDGIIESIDYAYETDGSTPQDAAWAYNVLGVLDGSGAVCEGYARTFQLLLNACGVENIYITGTAGAPGGSFSGHAWNLVKLEDGNWYWYDLTWDDHPGYILGIDYNYFCVNDTQNTNWMDGNVSGLTEYDFLDSHKPFDSSESGVTIPFTLPDRSAARFSDAAQPLVRQSFTSGGYKYAVAGYNIVQFAGGKVTGGILNIPETVNHAGRSYTVVSIGRVDENGLYGQGCVTEGYITSYRIPKTVRFLWDGAVETSEGYVTAYEVDPDSPNFTSPGGVLYTKSLYTLIAYPSFAPYVEQYVIPEETAIIACDALRCAADKIGLLVLGKNVKTLGVLNWGNGYPDGPTDEMLNTAVGELCGHTISVHPDNPYFKQVGDLICTLFYGTPYQVYLPVSPDIADVYIPDGIQSVNNHAFFGCSGIRSFSIPGSVTYFQGSLYSKNPLERIEYRGTVSQWQTFAGRTSFFESFPNVPVICTDGTVTVG